MVKTVKLGGLPLLAEEDITWPEIAGVMPATAEFDCEPDVADALVAGWGPHTLEIVKDDGTKYEWKHLYAQRKVSGKDPFRARVVVQDRRLFWRYGWIGPRRYNMRREHGYFRIQANDVAELERVDDLFQFASYSIKQFSDGFTRRYSAAEVLADIANEVISIETTSGGPTGSGAGLAGGSSPVVLDFGVADLPKVPVVDLAIDDRGDTAMMRVLEYMPGVDVKIDREGRTVFYSVASGLDRTMLPGRSRGDGPGPEVVGGGHSTFVDHRNEAPREIHFLFTIQAEVRFDYDASEERDVSSADHNDSSRKLRNVMPEPDYTATVGGKEVVQGTYVDIQDRLSGFGECPLGGSLTDEIVREGLCPWSDLFASALEVGKLTVDVDWATRIDHLYRHYYRTFRLPRDWHDRVLEWHDYRVATVNQATGTRAPAMSWGSYFKLASDRSIYRDYAESDDPLGERLHYGFNINGYPSTGIIDSTAKPNPGRVVLENAGQGIIGLQFDPDPTRVYTHFLPAQIETDLMPALHAPDQSSTPLTFDSMKNPGDTLPRLDDDHKVAVILTATPAAPNDKRQLYRVIVTPNDIRVDSAPPGTISAARTARGPIQEIRVPTGVEVARLRWIDGRSDEIEYMFGVGEAVPPDKVAIRDALLGDLCVNSGRDDHKIDPGPGGANIGAPLDEIAKAMATRIWASYVAHPQGSSTYDMDPEAVRVAGWVDDVQHVVLPSGETYSVVRFPDRLEEHDWISLMPRRVQAILLKEVPTG